jgi:hypothetical protein
MASFLAGIAAATSKVEPLPDTFSDPKGARALQARLATELGAVEASSDTGLFDLCREYREARKDMHRVFAERCTSGAEADALTARRDALLREIAKTRATTLNGFGAKMDILRSSGCAALETACPENPGDMLLQSVAADGYGLFGALDAILSAEEA